MEESFKNATAAAAFMKSKYRTPSLADAELIARSRPVYSSALLTDVDQSSFGDLQIELQAFVTVWEQHTSQRLLSHH